MKRVAAILLVAMLCCGFIPQHRASRQDRRYWGVSELYAEAIKQATIHHDTIGAVAAIEAIFQQDSNYGPALNLMARLSRRPDRSALYAERAYFTDTTNRYYLEDYGRALVAAGKYDKAVGVMKRIVDNKSTDPDHYRILALLYDSRKRPSEALAVLDTAEVRFGRISQLGRLRQYLLLKTGQTLLALADARKAVEEAPYIAENHIALGQVYATVRRDSLALVSFQQAIAIDSLDVEPWAALEEFYRDKGNIEQSLVIMNRLFASDKIALGRKIEEWRRLASDMANYRNHYPLYDQLIKRLYILYPDSRDVAKLYIQHLILSGEVEQALVMQKGLLAGEKRSVAEYLQVIEMESYLNRPDSVAHYTNIASMLFPENRQLLAAQSYLAVHNKEYDRAIAINKEMLKGAESDSVRSELWGSIGDIEHQRNNMKQCYKAYEKALRYDADNSSVLNNYAYFLSLEGRNLERAFTMATRATVLSENNPTFLDTKAWVLYKLGRYGEAKKVMQQALSLDRSQSPEFSLHYGDILFALGEEFMAKIYWRKALERGADAKEIERRFSPQTPQK
ncbi:MAG: tetratricopeptide repeat protein [Alistipes sp.]|nr:tetratricopeptide repeat protein [Alistipes sp.]